MFDTIVHVIGRAVEAVGIAAIVLGLIIASVRFLRRPRATDAFHQYRRDIGRSLLLGLELLVAADIIATVTTEPSLRSVVTLAIVVAIRTFLSFSIQLEVEGRLPWRMAPDVRQRSAVPTSER